MLDLFLYCNNPLVLGFFFSSYSYAYIPTISFVQLSLHLILHYEHFLSFILLTLR